jgi:hypothetical protein
VADRGRERRLARYAPQSGVQPDLEIIEGRLGFGLPGPIEHLDTPASAAIAGAP